MHHFAVQAQRNLARRDDVQAWSLVEQRADQGGDRVDDVLAPVQHQHRLGTGEPFDQALLAAGQVQGLGGEPGEGCGGVGGVEADQPDPSWGLTAAGCVDGQAALTDSGRPGQRHQAVVPGQQREGGEVGCTSHERRGERRQVVGRARKVLLCRATAWVCVQRGALPEDLGLEHLQSRTRLDTELVDQQRSHSRVGGQRLGLPSRPVESGDEGGPEALPERISLSQRFQLGDHLATGAEVDPGGEEVLEQAHPYLLELRALGLQPLALTDVDEDRSPEQREPLGGQRHGRRRVPGASGRRGGGGEADSS